MRREVRLEEMEMDRTHPVILVDEQDREIGVEEKVAAHERGALHRAVSVFAFDAQGALLVQRRADAKYHSGGLWSNSACTHPRVGESLDAAARRCMREELGVACVSLRRVTSFIYREAVSSSLVEHELDHLFVATVRDVPSPDPREVASYRYVTPDEIDRELAEDAARFTAWFPIALERLRESTERGGGE